MSASEWKRLWAYQVRTDDMFIGRKGDMRNLVFVTPEYDIFPTWILIASALEFMIQSWLLSICSISLERVLPKNGSKDRLTGPMPGINEKRLAKFVMPVPAQTEQDRVVEELHSVDMAGNAIKQRLNRWRDQKRIYLLN